MLSSIVFSILKSKIKKIILIFFCHMVIRVDTWCERFTLLYWKGIYINVWNTSLGTDHLTNMYYHMTKKNQDNFFNFRFQNRKDYT
jgi:hypothetical protein